MRAVLIALHVGSASLCALGFHALITGHLRWAAVFALAAGAYGFAAVVVESLDDAGTRS